MLKLVEIKKDYQLKDQEPVHALKGISLTFRKNEFVAILGHSGCGKTTLLNITGGLDHYDSGDLIIQGKSTKNFKDNDWDTYRNHSIGFVFQSYNLIPHQTILKNVELALTISGISKEERVKRAQEALDKVGLKGLYRKKPNQLSGGQMQRVAIARALVNNPEIVLADEPTGALDSETSVQIMELLKEVSKTHLVIMVTHNPELAEEYATRIVRMKDGKILSDTAPYNEEDEIEYKIEEFTRKETTYFSHEGIVDNKLTYYKKEEKEEKVTLKTPLPRKEKEVTSKGKGQSSMSFFTAFALSVSNLLSKAKRTILVAIAGSIGIIGVSTILGVSCGVTDYINDMQNDMLSSYPIQIAEESVDMTSLIAGLSSNDKKEAATFDTNTRVGMDSMISYLLTKYTDFTNVKTNDINQMLLDYLNQMPESYYASVDKNYSIDPSNNFFTAFKKEKDSTDKRIISMNGLTQQYIKTLMTVDGFSEYAQFVDLFTSFMKQVPGNKEYILSQYDLIGNSKYPENANELMLVVDDKTTLTDLVLAQMGYYPQDEFLNIAKKAVKQNEYEKKIEELKRQSGDHSKEIAELEEKIALLDKEYPYERTFTYEDLLGHEFYYYPHDAIYKANPDFVSHRETSIALTGKFGNNLIIVNLNYVNSSDSMNGTVLMLDNNFNIVMSMPAMFNRSDPSPDPENGSFADGKWEIDYQGSHFALTDSSSDKTSTESGGITTYTYKTNAVLSFPLGSFNIPIQLSGQTTEIESLTPDFYYNSIIDQTSEMYLNPESVGGAKVKVTGVLRAKSTTNFGSLSRGVYFSKEFTDKYMSQAKTSAINQAFETHVKDENFKVSSFNAYVKFKYDDYTNDDGEGHGIIYDKDGFASSLNGDSSSTILSIFASFLSSGKDNLDTDKLHLRALSGLKINQDEETSEYSFDAFPESISIYPKDFKQKDNVVSYLNDWNANKVLKINGQRVERNERSEITVTDTISMIVAVISTLVTTISAALIAFTSLSLVVSCFMIAVITYISVMERVKEIGVIRSLGGRKKDVSRLFIAENLMTGLASGVLGIAITYILQIIINIIVKGFGIARICALPWYYALMMIAISVTLSILSGLIPSLSASKQDPVIALRSE